MKKLWNGVSFLAVVNLLAMAMVGFWLWKTGRLDGTRLQEIKLLLSSPIVAPATEAEIPAVDQVAAADPIDSRALNRQLSRLDEQELLMQRRLTDEQRILATQVTRQMEKLIAARRELEEAQAELKGSQATAMDTQSAEQFAKVVRHLESIPAAQAKRVLRTLVDDGKTEQAVAYLDAMQPRTAAKVLREFKTEPEAALAVELLERIRRLGSGAASAVGSG